MRTRFLVAPCVLAAGVALVATAHAAPRGRGPQKASVGTFEAVGCTVTGWMDKSQSEMTEGSSYRKVTSNGIPDHATGPFPNRGNPHEISAQRYDFKMPMMPSGQGRSLGMQAFGVAVNGVVFDPGAAEWWQDNPRSGWQYEALSGAVGLGVDCNNAHVQPSGAYHYHGMPEGILAAPGSVGQMVLVGYAADGYPVYGRYGEVEGALRGMKSSYRLRSGQRPSGPGGTFDGMFVEDYEYVAGLGDLDECNGRVGVTPEHGETYHYYVTDGFPFIPRCFSASPDKSFERKRGPGGPGGGPPRGGPPGGRRGLPPPY